MDDCARRLDDHRLASLGARWVSPYQLNILLSVFIARYGRGNLGANWVTWHRWTMILAVVLAVTAGTIAWVHCTNHFDKPHKIIGPLLTTLLIVQAVWGTVIHGLRDPMRTRKPWYNQVHRVFGPLLWVMAVINIGLGISDHGQLPWWIWLVGGGWLALLVAIFARAEYWHRTAGDFNNFDDLSSTGTSTPIISATPVLRQQ